MKNNITYYKIFEYAEKRVFIKKKKFKIFWFFKQLRSCFLIIAFFNFNNEKLQNLLNSVLLFEKKNN